MKRQSLLAGALALTASGVAVKVLGWLYRIVLPRLLGGGELGAYGVGVFGIAVTLYQIVGLTTTYGVPIATSKTLAGIEDGSSRRSFFRMMVDVVTAGAFGFAGLIVVSVPVIGIGYGMGAGLGCLLVVPAVVFSARMGLISGYFESHSNMVPRAVAQVTEQTTRVVAILAIALSLAAVDVGLAGGGAAAGFSVGSGLSLIYMHWAAKKHDVPFPSLGGSFGRLKSLFEEQHDPRIREYVRLAGLVAITGAVVPVLNLVDMWVLPLRAHALGYSSRSATVAFGVVTQMALPIVMAPAVVTTSLTTSMVPRVAGSVDLKPHFGSDSIVLRSLAIGIWILLPATIILSQFGSELAHVFWDYAKAGSAIKVLAYAVPLYGAFQIFSGAAQAKGHPKIPAIAMVLGCLVKAASDWLLVGMISDMALAVAIATFVALTCATGICMRAAFNWRDSVRRWIRMQLVRQSGPFLLCVATIWAGEAYLPRDESLLKGAIVVLALAGYVAVSIMNGTVRRREFQGVPILGRLA